MAKTATVQRIRDDQNMRDTHGADVIPDAPISNHIQEMANKAYDLADGDWKRSAEIIHEWIDKNAELRLALLETLIDKAIWDLVRRTARLKRKPFFSKPKEDELEATPSSKDDTSGIALVSKRNWHEFPLPLVGGMKLGDATKADLIIAADTYRQRALANGNRAQWLNRIIEKMPDEKPVRDVLSNDELERLA